LRQRARAQAPLKCAALQGDRPDRPVEGAEGRGLQLYSSAAIENMKDILAGFEEIRRRSKSEGQRKRYPPPGAY
jgi:hypothetical protein